MTLQRSFDQATRQGDSWLESDLPFVFRGLFRRRERGIFRAVSDAEPTSYRAVIAYDGRDYFGWQRLAEKETVQGTLEEAIAAAFGEETPVQGAGRTDRGAHAEGQVAGFRLTRPREVAEITESLNEFLPDSVRVMEVQAVPNEFHARMSAIGKEYAYVIWNDPDLPEELVDRVWHVPEHLSFEAMEEAMPALVGRHDFASFATKTRFTQKSTERELYSAKIEREDSGIRFWFHGDSFLNHMVRNIVRAVVKVGEGKYEPGKIAEILKARKRSASPGSAPASGLCLMQVFYPEESGAGQVGD